MNLVTGGTQWVSGVLRDLNFTSNGTDYDEKKCNGLESLKCTSSC